MKTLLLTLLVLTTAQKTWAQSYEQQEQETVYEQLLRQSQVKLYRANCVRVPLDVEPTSVCAEDHLWGVGASGGYICCQHPPT
ncbi:hypothetical protein ACLSU7_01550 [Bdellovibrio sp. HCB185ZH]|uniref:hypothetical protein n=1 Tax=Bdellovibrio sp. HCB185ZH TaxID=3394235 RepID=UPI0039A5C1E8